MTDGGVGSKLALWAEFTRARLSPTAVSNTLLGMAIAAPESLATTSALAAAGAAICFYLFGMGLNDLLDLGRDREIAPSRALPSGRLSLRAAISGVCLFVASGATIAHFAGPVAFRCALFIVCAIVLYDLITKHIPFVGSMTMGAVRALLVPFGAAFANPEAIRDEPTLGLAAISIGVYVTVLTFLSEAEEKPETRRVRMRSQIWMCCLFGVVASVTLRESLEPFPVAAAVALLLLVHGWVLKPALGSPPKVGLTTFRGLRSLFAVDAWLATCLAPWALVPTALCAGVAHTLLHFRKK